MVERLLEHRRGEPVDLGVAAGRDAGAGEFGDGGERLAEAAGHAAQPVVHGLVAVDRDARRHQAGLDRGLDLGPGQRAAAGLQPAFDAGIGHRPDDVEPVAPKIGLAADQADLAGAELGELGGHRADLVDAELVAARPAGARAAMGAPQIAGEGQLPDDMDRMPALDDRAPSAAAPARRAAVRPGSSAQYRPPRLWISASSFSSAALRSPC